jgi:hypothetical protein
MPRGWVSHFLGRGIKLGIPQPQQNGINRMEILRSTLMRDVINEE